MSDIKISISDEGKLILSDIPNINYLLVADKDVEVIVNGGKIDGDIVITSKDEVLLLIKKENIPKEVMVRISPDKMRAYVRLKPAVEYYMDVNVGSIDKIINNENDKNLKNSAKKSEYIIKKDKDTGEKTKKGEDSKEADDKNIDVENKKLIIDVLLKSKEVYNFTLEDLNSALEDNGVVYGVNEDALQKLLDNEDGKEVLAAEGSPPKKGVDENINILVNTGPILQVKRLPDGKVDFKRIRTIETVLPGHVIAVKIPGRPGVAGVNVLGENIPPPDYKRLILETGEGAEIDSGGFNVVSTIKGLPNVKAKKDVYLFEVRKVFVTDEVSLATGNLEFDGDVIVQRDVQEGMSVFATGSITIDGSVFNAKITALGDVHVGKNVIHSFVNAGVGSDYINQLKDKLHYIANCLHSISKGVSMLVIQFEQMYPEQVIPVGRMVMGIINTKFKDLFSVINEVNKTLRKKECIVSSDVKDVIDELDIRFKRLGWLKTKDSEEVSELHKKVIDAIKSLESSADEELGNVVVSYVFSSAIEASCDVHVVGRGCVSTNINAKGDVTVDKVFRAGVINCQGNVKIDEAGSEMGAKTLINASGDWVQIEKTYPNVIIKLGEEIKRLSLPEYKVFIKNNNIDTAEEKS